MSNYLTILQTYYGGRNKSETARICNCSRGTVDTTLSLARQMGLIDRESLALYTEDTIAQMLHPGVYQPGWNKVYAMPDYADVHKELAKPHVTLKLLWEEYVLFCQQAATQPYSETQFRCYYHRYAKDQQVTLRLKHKPAYAMQIDWAGTKYVFYDEEVGGEISASIFVAVLPYSQLMYAEPCRDEKSLNWLSAHTNALAYFGGAPKVFVPDNLKTGVTRADFYEPALQKKYAEMADYYGCVVLPARARKPRDKGAVENSVLIASRRIIATLRNAEFRSFSELQQGVRDRLETLNHVPLTGRKVSRWEVYSREEAQYMQTLPEQGYEYAEWKSDLKVAPDCHIAFQKKHYSVPFEYVGKTVDVRATLRTLEIFYHHERIASHKRSYGTEFYVTEPEHIPPEKTYFQNWDRERFLKWGKCCGTACVQVLIAILDRAVVEEQAHRSCLGVVSLANKQGKTEVEEACRQALKLTPEPSYQLVKKIVRQNKDSALKPAQSEAIPRGFQRGAAYFGGNRHAQ